MLNRNADNVVPINRNRAKAGELQIQIDDVYACLGHCAGCVLSADERRASAPDMTEATLLLSVERLKEHASSVGPLNRINVTFGIADHLLIGADYLVRLHELGSEIVRAGRPADPAHSAVFFTTSLVGKPSSVIALLREVRSRISGDVPLIPLVVLDGRLIKAAKFGPMWKDMVTVAKELFGKVDLSTNLSVDGVDCMSPAELARFAARNGFDEVTVNWAPTLGNASGTLDGNELIGRWILDFDTLAQKKHMLTTSFRPVIERTVDSVMCREGSAPSLVNSVEQIVPETVRKSIEIDHLGFILPKLEAIGDIAHADRHGLKPLGHLSDGPIELTIAKAMPRMLSKIIGIHAQGACSTCRHSAVCAGTGFHVATHVARATGRSKAAREVGCPHFAYDIIDRIVSERRVADEFLDRDAVWAVM